MCSPALMSLWDAEGYLNFHQNDPLARVYYKKLRKIQEIYIPLIIDGNNVQCNSQTGSGKTAAYLIPLIKKCKDAVFDVKPFPSGPNTPFEIIICPTRSDISFGRNYGQMNVEVSVAVLSEHVHILVTTPGRFQYSNFKLVFRHLKFRVFDDATELFTTNFKDIDLKIYENDLNDNDTFRILCFSGSDGYDEVFQEIAKNCPRVTIQQIVAVNSNIVQTFVNLDYNQRMLHIMDLLKDKSHHKKGTKCIIFTNSIEESELFGMVLMNFEFSAAPFSSIRSQEIRDNTIKEFQGDRLDIIVTTDVCARGMDVKCVDLVINLSLPKSFNTYVHQVGRCGLIRAGKAISFVNLKIDAGLIREIY
uniref:ATP-dependent RNA helicase n=1 Tax=Panagrolaimus superbus TaxID=310955 RepID=A0A914XUT8_9BILA